MCHLLLLRCSEPSCQKTCRKRFVFPLRAQKSLGTGAHQYFLPRGRNTVIIGYKCGIMRLSRVGGVANNTHLKFQSKPRTSTLLRFLHVCVPSVISCSSFCLCMPAYLSRLVVTAPYSTEWAIRSIVNRQQGITAPQKSEILRLVLMNRTVSVHWCTLSCNAKKWP